MVKRTLSVSGKKTLSSNRPWHIETHGIDVVPDHERTGRVWDLFWIWFAGNIGLLALVYGAILLTFGLNFWQGLLAIVTGSLSFILVGVLSVAGRDGGAPMMALSRQVFGVYGNVLPSLVSWLSLVGWETITMITGTLAFMALFADVSHLPLAMRATLSMTLLMGLVIALSLLGQATLVVIQRWGSYVFGLLSVLVIGLLLVHARWHMVLTRPAGPWISGFLPALSIVIAGTGLSWANTAADYSRYIPHRTSRFAIVTATTMGAFIPLVILMAVGMLVATQEPSLATSANPIAAIEKALPPWMSIPYLLTAAGGLIVEADLSLYSSGLNLLTMFVPFSRYRTIIVDAVIMVAGTIYVIFVAKNFLGPLESFTLLLGIGLAAWAGIFITDQFFLRSPHDTVTADALGAGPVRWRAVLSWIMAVLAGLAFTASPLFQGPLARGVFADSSLELLIAFGTATLLYLVTGLLGGRAP